MLYRQDMCSMAMPQKLFGAHAIRIGEHENFMGGRASVMRTYANAKVVLHEQMSVKPHAGSKPLDALCMNLKQRASPFCAWRRLASISLENKK